MKYVVFDIETTGLNTLQDRIIEIGAVKVEDGIILEEFSMFINPGIHIPDHVSLINNIYDDMVEDAPLPGVVLYKFHQFIKDVDFLIGHNAKRFDYPFLESEFNRHFVKFNSFQVKDTMWVARAKVRGLRSYSLAALCRVFSIENKDAHRALSDVYATHHVYLELLKR
jgi:DNA polymerase III epsilon subunit family exonuclease